MEFLKFIYGDEEIVAFFDESGDEKLGDPNNPVFVLACCFVMGKDLPSIRSAWCEVRRSIHGRKDHPIHMRETQLTSENEDLVRNFFASEKFYRASVAITDRTIFKNGKIPFDPVFEISLELIKQLFIQVLSGTKSSGASLIFEHSERLEKRYLSVFPRFGLIVDGEKLPICWKLMPKSDSEPALEIADYIAHTTSGHMRHNRAKESKFSKRFEAIFRNKKNSMFWEVNKYELLESS